jgi:hypothetical protein
MFHQHNDVQCLAKSVEISRSFGDTKGRFSNQVTTSKIRRCYILWELKKAVEEV